MGAAKRRKKLKLLILVGITSLVILSGLTIWASISAIRYVVSVLNQTELPTIVHQQIENFKKEVQAVPSSRVLGCWDKTQSLLTVQPWFDQTVAVNIENLKVACLGSMPKTCEGTDCETK